MPEPCVKLISCECRCKFDSRKCNSKQKWSNDKCQYECKKPIKHCVCEKEYAWNPSICACVCDKDCDICEYLEDCTFMKSLVDNLIVACDAIVDTPETTWINPNDKTNCWLIAFVSWFITKIYELQRCDCCC